MSWAAFRESGWNIFAFGVDFGLEDPAMVVVTVRQAAEKLQKA